MKISLFILITFLSLVNLISQERTYQVELLKKGNNPLLSIIMDYSCFDEDNCIIVRTDDNGAGLMAEKTSDGGKSWKLLYADTSFKSDDSIYYPEHTAERVKYFSDGIIIILTDKGKVLRSEDFGESFSEYKIDNFSYTGFEMLDKNRAIITSWAWAWTEGSKDFIKKSYDGCKTWEDYNISDTNYSEYYSGVYILPDNKMIINLQTDDSTKNYYAITDFDGSFWKYIHTSRYIRKLHFFDDNVGIGVGRIPVAGAWLDTGVISKTYNGGESWDVKLKTTFPIEAFSDIGYMNDSLIMVSGSKFSILYSTDKGESWLTPRLEFIGDAIGGTWFSDKFTKISDDKFFFRTSLSAQLLKLSRITSSVIDATLKPRKIYPNPIYKSSSFTSEYELKTSGMLKMYISDLSGRELFNLFNGFEDSGQHSRTFNFPETLGSGSYWIVSEINGYRHVQMLNVVK